MKQLLFFFLIILFAIQQITVLSGCANIIPPSGGPKDTLPPKLVKVSPADSSKNFSANRISFSFDEYIDVQNVQDNLIVSPLPKIIPDVRSNLKTLTVRLRDTLEPNTTYSLNFGNAIKDYNEGNVLKNFTYIFSTGNFMDSLQLSGKVILAEDGKTDSSLIVMLHRSREDSAVMKEKPRYFTRLNKSGNFVFKNLPPGTFYIYALQNQGNNFLYMKKSQLFAFADSAIIVAQNIKHVTLYAYSEKPPNKEQAPTLQLLTPGRIKEAQKERLKFQNNLSNGKQDLLDTFVISFDQKLKFFDSSKTHFSTDSSFQPVSNYSWEKDSTGKKLKLITAWKENTLYHLVLEKDFAEDSLGKKLLRNDTITFTTRRKEDYGNLLIHFRNWDASVNPVLLFVQNNEIKRSFPLTSADFSQSLFLPGEYELRILQDKNKNGKWDPGEFFGKHKQPEIVKPIERRITVKADNKNEFEIAL